MKELDILKAFFSKHRKFEFKKRDTILYSNDKPQGVYFINEGLVRSYKLDADGKEFTSIMFKQFDIFSMRWVLNDINPSHNYQALTDAVVFRAPKDDFLTLLKENPAVMLYMTKKILDVDGTTLRRLEASIMGNAAGKLAGTILFLAESFGIEKQSTTIIEDVFTHQELATMVGMTRETVSLEIENLRKEGIIVTKDRQIIISDMERLKEKVEANQ